MTQGKNLSLARGKLAKLAPYHPLSLALHGGVLRALMAITGAFELVKFFGAAAPSFPPTGAQSIAAGVGRHCNQPFVPGFGALAGAIEAKGLEKNLLRHLLGFV